MNRLLRVCAVGLGFALSMATRSSADSGHTCPDYSQHDAVLRQGQDSLKNSPVSPATVKLKIYQYGDFAPFIPELQYGGGKFSHSGFGPGNKNTKLRLPSGLKGSELRSDRLPEPAVEPEVVDESSWLPCIRAAIFVAVRHKNMPDSFRDPRTEVQGVLKQFGNLKALQNWNGKWLKQRSDSVSGKFLQALLDYPSSTYVEDVELLSSAWQALESLYRSSSKVKWRSCDLLCLAGLRAWFGEYDSALSLCEKLATASNPADFGEVDAGPQIVAYAIAINNRRNDWKQLAVLEDECVVTSDGSACAILSDIYVRRDRTADLLRLFRKTSKWQNFNPQAFTVIIRNAEDQDLPRITDLVRRKRIDDMAIAKALASKRLFGDALTVCSNTNNPLASEPSYVITEVRKKYPTEYLSRLVFAASVCFDLKTMTFGRSLLTGISEPCLRTRLDTVAQAHENLRDVDGLIRCMSSIATNPDVVETLQKLRERREYILERKETLECLALSEKLEETGNTLLVRGQYEEAKKVYTSALDIRRKQLKPTDCLVGNTLQNLAQTNMMLKDMAVADQQFEESISIYSQANATDLLREVLEKYGDFLNYIGNTSKAAIIYKEAKHYPR